MLELDDRELLKFQGTLERLAHDAIPFATRNTVNTLAFNTRRRWQENIGDTFTERNKWTRNSIRVETAKTLDVRKQEAVVGSLAEYLARNEFGATVRKRGKIGVPIATAYSAGQGEGQRPRTRLPRKPNKLSSIQLKRRQRATQSRKQRNVIAVKTAAKNGDKFVYLDLGRREGIFRILGGKRAPRLKMVYDLTRDTVAVPKQPTLAPAVAATSRELAAIYKKSLRFQLKQRGLL